MNTLYYGDNLDILRTYIKDESVDLVYLDPPFNSNRSYNILFKEAGKTADSSQAQIEAFDDTWHWENGPAEETMHEIEMNARRHVAEMIKALVKFVGRNDVTAYLVMMTVRLVELHRVLKPTGSLYLHCDPTASHYLKVVMDTIFGPVNFKSEIIWKRSSAHSDAAQGRRQHGRIHDVILFYTKSNDWTWNPVYTTYDSEYTDGFYKYIEEGTGRRYRLGDITGPGGAAKGNPSYEVMGVTRFWRYSKEKMNDLIKEGRIVQTKPGAVPAYKRYLDEMPGVPIQDIWADIGPIGAQAQERLGYPTQKPLALLERIIQASSNPGDLVLDPFCGCGTTVCAAQKLGRQWIGIDITHLAIGLMKKRLTDLFPGAEFQVVGQPADVASAAALFNQDPYKFEQWALSLIQAQPAHEKKGADRGLDGILPLRDEVNKVNRVAVQVKGGHVHVGYIRDLCHVVEREGAVMGYLITLEEPSRPMEIEAQGMGYYHSQGWGQDYPKVQIRTVAQLLRGEGFSQPPAGVGYARAGREKEEGKQGRMM
ncbi:MAG: DNA methyltransferase [Anaerolineae bacterium]